MATTLANVLAPLHARYAGALAACSVVVRGLAQRMARQAPFVHRFGKAGGPPWRDVFFRGELTAGIPCTDCERQAGVARTVYFFLASGAYARGSIAVIVEHSFALGNLATATAFDSGACADHAANWLDCSSAPFTSAGDRCAFIASNKLDQAHSDLHEFIEPFLVAHFDDPVDYIRRSQKSVPDRPVYHGLQSPTRDRRAWTIELQRQTSLSIAPDPVRILRIVLADRDLFTAIPAPYRRLASVAAPNSMEDAVADFCHSKVA